jgi:hypothetical protein
MANVKFTGLESFKNKLKKLEARYPELKRDTLNDLAFISRSTAQKNISKEFIIRNNFTTGSVRVNKATDAKGSYAEMGSVQDYMRIQELGDTEKISSIPTNAARVQKLKEKRIIVPLRLSKLGTLPHIAAGKKNAMIAIKIAAKKSGKIKPMVLNINGRPGIFRLEGPRKKLKLFKIHDLSRKHVEIKKKPWLTPAVQKTEKFAQRVFVRNANKYFKK